MYKALTLVFALILAVSAFHIQTESAPAIVSGQQVEAIPWPFTICGEADWTIESLTLDQTPKRNINDNIVAVIYYIYLDWYC